MKVTYIHQKQSFADVLQDHQDILREIVFSPSNKVIEINIYCTVIPSFNTRLFTYAQIHTYKNLSEKVLYRVI